MFIVHIHFVYKLFRLFLYFALVGFEEGFWAFAFKLNLLLTTFFWLASFYNLLHFLFRESIQLGLFLFGKRKWAGLNLGRSYVSLSAFSACSVPSGNDFFISLFPFFMLRTLFVGWQPKVFVSQLPYNCSRSFQNVPNLASFGVELYKTSLAGIELPKDLFVKP